MLIFLYKRFAIRTVVLIFKEYFSNVVVPMFIRNPKKLSDLAEDDKNASFISFGGILSFLLVSQFEKFRS